MQKLLELLKDGHSRTVEMLAVELHTSAADISRQLEYLEHIGKIRRIVTKPKACTGCSGCEGGTGCHCMPDGALDNMGEIWEIVN